MPTVTLKHEIQCDEETFWKLFADREFNEKLYSVGLQFPEFSVVKQDESDREITRTTKGRPKMNMPGPVAKLLGSSFGYVEEGRFDKATRVWSWKIIPSTLADKMKTQGTVRIEPIAEGKVRRVVDFVIEAKVFGLGGMLESTAEKSMRDGWEKSAAFMNDWVKKTKG